MEDALSQFVPVRLLAQGGEVGVVRDEAELQQDGRHCGAPEDQERVLGDAAVGLDGPALEMLLGQLGEADALLEVGVLHQVHEDIGLGIVRVETAVGGRVVIFQEDDGVLPPDDLHVVGVQVAVLVGGLAEHVDGEAVGAGLADRVDVHRDEKVGLGLVGDVGTVVERDVTVVGPREDHLDVRVAGADFVGQGPGDVEDEGLLVGFLVPADCAGVLAAVPGVDHDRRETQFVPGGKRHAHECGEEDADCTFQKFVVIL